MLRFESELQKQIDMMHFIIINNNVGRMPELASIRLISFLRSNSYFRYAVFIFC